MAYKQLFLFIFFMSESSLHAVLSRQQIIKHCAEPIFDASVYRYAMNAPNRQQYDLAVYNQSNWIFSVLGTNDYEQLYRTDAYKPQMMYKDLQACNDTFACRQPATGPMCYVVQGVNVQHLAWAERAQNGIVQLASQYNYLESPTDKLVDVSKYVYDKTQGPLGAIMGLSALLQRDFLVRNGYLDHMLSEVLPDLCLHDDISSSVYRNGYLQLHKASADDLFLIYKIIKDQGLGKLKMYCPWVVCEVSKSYHMQVLCAAPSFQGSHMPLPGSISYQIALHLIVAQYRALAWIARIRSHSNPDEQVSLHLTLIGMGVFNNNPDMIPVIMQVLHDELYDCENLNVYMHVFTQHDYEHFISYLPQSLQGCYQTMSAEEFLDAFND